MGAGGRYKLRIHGVGRAGTSTVFPQAVFALCDSTKTLRCLVPASRAGRFKNEKNRKKTMKIRRGPKMQYILLFFGQHRTIPALRLKHRSGSLFPPLAALTFAASSFWPSSYRTSLAVSALRIMRYCHNSILSPLKFFARTFFKKAANLP